MMKEKSETEMENASWSMKMQPRSLLGVSDAFTVYHLLQYNNIVDMMKTKGEKRDSRFDPH